MFEKLKDWVDEAKVELSFREFVLKEAKNYQNLYHFTIPSKIRRILKEGIKPGNEGYVSLTRNFNLTKDGYFNTGEYIVRITIDGKKFTENNKMLQNTQFECIENAFITIKPKYFKKIEILSDYRVFDKEYVDFLVNDIKELEKVSNWYPVRN